MDNRNKNNNDTFDRMFWGVQVNFQLSLSF